MKVKYKMTKGVVMPVFGESIVTYGIQAKDEEGKMVDFFEDVSLNKLQTQSILDILNNCKVDLCHFRDVIIDELNR